MLERGDLLALHEPLEGLSYIGPLEIGSCRFESPQSLIRWLLNPSTTPVFLKETVNRTVLDVVRSDHRFLAEVHHGFLIRRPEEVAASWFALEGDMRILDTGIEALHELYVAVRNAEGHRPVVIDSDDLVAQPEATMRAYCTEIGLPFVADALTWDAGARHEWHQTSRWHEDISASTGFVQPDRRDRHALVSHSDVIRSHRIIDRSTSDCGPNGSESTAEVLYPPRLGAVIPIGDSPHERCSPIRAHSILVRQPLRRRVDV